MSEDTALRLGEWLQARREKLAISLEQAEEETRIRARYLEALETEDLEALPDTVVGRGFLRNYVTYLGLDPRQGSDLYSALVGPPEPESLPASVPEGSAPLTSGPFRPVPLHEVRPQRSRRGWIIAVLAVVSAAALAAAGWWAHPWITDWLFGVPPSATLAQATGTEQAIGPELRTSTPTRVASSPSTVPPALTVPTGTAQPPLPTRPPTHTPSRTPSRTPTATSIVYTGIFLELAFTDLSWIQVTVDGVRDFQGELEIGTYRAWYGEERIELRIGNAGAVEITLNGQKLGTLGEPGEVIDRVFEKVGDRVGEATVTPVTPATPTEEITLTATPPVPTESTPLTPTATLTLTVTTSP